MTVYLLQVTSCSDEDREYFMPWYSDYFVFDSPEKREGKIKELMAENKYLGDENFHETELEIM